MKSGILTQCSCLIRAMNESVESIVDRKQNQMSTLCFLLMCFDYSDEKTEIGKYSVAELYACKTTVEH